MPPKGTAAAKLEAGTGGKKLELLAEVSASLSKEDLDEAKKVLAKTEGDATEKRRLESNMTYYLKKTGELEAGASLRGDRRRNFMLLFLAKQM